MFWKSEPGRRAWLVVWALSGLVVAAGSFALIARQGAYAGEEPSPAPSPCENQCLEDPWEQDPKVVISFPTTDQQFRAGSQITVTASVWARTQSSASGSGCLDPIGWPVEVELRVDGNLKQRKTVQFGTCNPAVVVLEDENAPNWALGEHTIEVIARDQQQREGMDDVSIYIFKMQCPLIGVRSCNTDYSAGHPAWDLDAQLGDAILAAERGSATADVDEDCGVGVFLRHGWVYWPALQPDGKPQRDEQGAIQYNSAFVSTLYCHLQTGSAHYGFVVKGLQIGKVGMTGKTDGPHLHFGVYHGEVIVAPVSPCEWVQNCGCPCPSGTGGEDDGVPGGEPGEPGGGIVSLLPGRGVPRVVAVLDGLPFVFGVASSWPRRTETDEHYASDVAGEDPV